MTEDPKAQIVRLPDDLIAKCEEWTASVSSRMGTSYCNGGRCSGKNFSRRFAANHCNVERAGVEERSNLHVGCSAGSSRSLVYTRSEIVSVKPACRNAVSLLPADPE